MLELSRPPRSAVLRPPRCAAPERTRERGLDLVKWLALACMVVDHLRFLLPGQALLGWALVPGRLAFPLFCLALAANLARRPAAGFAASERRQLGLLIGFALLSEPAHDLLRGHTDKLNILVTLALGWGIAWGCHARRRGPLLLAALLAAAAAGLHARLNYGLPGALLAALCLLALRRGGLCTLLASLDVLLGNLGPRLLAALPAPQPRDLLIVAACLGAVPLGLWLLRLPLPAQLRVPAVGRWAYFFYPLHMLAIAAAAWLLRAH